MSPYTQLSLGIIAAAGSVGLVGMLILWGQRRRIPYGSLLCSTLVMLILTIIFDNVMIAVDLYRYPMESFSGLTVGLMPLEDFSYPLATCLVLPIWFMVFAPSRPQPVIEQR